MKAGQDPYYNPDKISWKGVDVELWREINKKRTKEYSAKDLKKLKVESTENN